MGGVSTVPAADVDVVSDPESRGRRPTRPRHFASFDGLRAIAAITVVGVHSAFDSGFTFRSSLGVYAARLEIGVSVFFLISGFLLYRPFAASHLAGGPAPSAGNFWTRRLLRILPAYWLAYVVTTWVLKANGALPDLKTVLVDMGFGQIYSSTYILTGIGQAWSLCTEMSFYLFLPLFAAALAWRRRSDEHQLRRELTAVAVLYVFGLAFRYWVLNQHPIVSGRTAGLPSCLDLFALGMLLAVVSSWLSHRDTAPRLLWHPAMPWASWGAAALLFFLVSHIGLSTKPLGQAGPRLGMAEELLYGAFAFFLLLPAVFGPERHGAIRRALQWKPVVAIGVVSYGIYLWHQAWLYILFFSWGKPLLAHGHLFGTPYDTTFLVAVALSVAAASASYFVVEKPALRLKGRVGWWSVDRRRRHLDSSGPTVVSLPPIGTGGPAEVG